MALPLSTNIMWTLLLPHCDDQSFSMRVVHPLSVHLYEYDVFRPSLGIYLGVLVCFVHECLRQVPSFLSVPIACTTTLFGPTWASNNGEDFSCNMWIFNTLSSPNRDLPMEACYSSPRVNTCPLYANIPWVHTCPLYANNPWINIHPLYANSPAIYTCLLYFHRVLWV